jgi:hypothetical protein
MIDRTDRKILSILQVPAAHEPHKLCGSWIAGAGSSSAPAVLDSRATARS